MQPPAALQSKRERLDRRRDQYSRADESRDPVDLAGFRVIPRLPAIVQAGGQDRSPDQQNDDRDHSFSSKSVKMRS